MRQRQPRKQQDMIVVYVPGTRVGHIRTGQHVETDGQVGQQIGLGIALLTQTVVVAHQVIYPVKTAVQELCGLGGQGTGGRDGCLGDGWEGIHQKEQRRRRHRETDAGYRDRCQRGSMTAQGWLCGDDDGSGENRSPGSQTSP